MSQEREAVDRIFALLATDISQLEFQQALSEDGPLVGSATLSPAERLQFFLAGLQEHGPREFLERTAHLLPANGGPLPTRVRRRAVGQRRRVAIYGGAFDPITNAHLTCAAEIVHSQCADEVWLSPCGPRPDKPSMQTCAIDRYCMCQVAVNIAFSHKFSVRVSDLDCFSPRALPTYDLLCGLRARHPRVDFVFVIGSDWLQPGTNIADWTSLNPAWSEGDPEDDKYIVTGHKLLSEFDFLVIPRPGYDVPTSAADRTGLKKFGDRLRWLEMPEGTTFIEGNLSSSEIRQRTRFAVRAREAATALTLADIDGLCPRSVLSYIWRHKLYIPKQVSAARRVAIYGGAFDPITNSHLTCAAEIVHSGCADEVWLVPCGPRPDKPGLKTLPIDRLCMCHLAVNSTFMADFPVRVHAVECFSEVAFYTYDLLCSLRNENPGVRFSFVIGSDWLQPGSNMAEWKSVNHDWRPGDPESERLVVTGDKMLSEFEFLVIRRPGYEVPSRPGDPTGLKQFGPNLHWLTMREGQTYVEGNLSSTEVRHRTAFAARIRGNASSEDWESIEGLVPPGVLAFIRRQQLYVTAR